MQPRRIVVFGNSGSGKSTLAHQLSRSFGLEHLDLDSIAWKPELPPVRRPFAESAADLETFFEAHPSWVVEGCYADLVAEAARHSTEMVFLNPPIDVCLANCRDRPWEPHKYSSEAAQSRNLQMLLEWVQAYTSRGDEFSLKRHREVFDSFGGAKHELRSNEEARRFAEGE